MYSVHIVHLALIRHFKSYRSQCTWGTDISPGGQIISNYGLDSMGPLCLWQCLKRILCKDKTSLLCMVLCNRRQQKRRTSNKFKNCPKKIQKKKTRWIFYTSSKFELKCELHMPYSCSNCNSQDGRPTQCIACAHKLQFISYVYHISVKSWCRTEK